ncbi:ATP-binding protein [Bacillus sp. S/N-304-OC-R1]|uniref:ATP-binding protein n=1 Tax=Bacillus sp. S/N-304-OC-R1 TaxID=2758034 RepID=UPI001C8DCF4C|nr:ATP-binding protein [Bacillus sp. S/N-304-OC-R1]MBY0124389.1 ATP-binding protein [Bacillus sp. S/N-304-OC-R1]
MGSLDVRRKDDLQQSLAIAEEFIEKNYLLDLAKHEVIPVPDHIKELTVRQHIRLFQVTKIVYDKNEDISEKLINVYNAVGNLNSSLVLVIDSDGQETNLYMGVRSGDIDQNITTAKESMEKSFTGNFPGTDLRNLRNKEIESVIEGILQNTVTSNNKVITSVSGIPALKDVEKVQYIQGLEKLIDSMKNEKFSAIFIADRLDTKTVSRIRQGYEALYTELSPFQQTELSFGESDSQAVTEGISKGITNTISDSISKTQSHTTGKSEGSSKNISKSSSTSSGYSFILSISQSSSKSDSVTTSSNYNTSETEGSSLTNGSSKADSETTNNSNTLTSSNSRNLQIKFENKTVSNLLIKIDEQLMRLKSSEDFGLWNCGCYFLADNPQTAKVVSSTYQAIIRGDNSSVEHSFLNTWSTEEPKKLAMVTDYLTKFHHPLIQIERNIGFDMPYVTPSTLVNGRELAIGFGLPRKSVSGLPVVESAEFGRNVLTYDREDDKYVPKVQLGKIFHMGKVENTIVDLDLQSLSMHTFITGSTGSGKSNTVYSILDSLSNQKVNFLIVEPTKGEYKHIFGNRSDVSVFGTNPEFSNLLKINPFKFPRGIHVLEHIDRLVEIFNVCWPMYAAMPAVLKEAIIKSYETSGWDLITSKNKYSEEFFPTFGDLLVELQNVIESSAYSSELKSNYTGALVTRVKSLTNGLNGFIFHSGELDNALLFDSNVIIDLSRVGSLETKSFIMGVLVMRLSEHRMCFSKDMNEPLKHVTVLEEAHHILKKTSMEQSNESSNLIGKSVEMLSNAIAEMRTYGEGFIIADQSPNAVDISAIRNTNTKIIMRLPDDADRKLAGGSAALKNEQLDEIAKLPRGVAVVYQNDWLDPVLCKINKFEYSKEKYQFSLSNYESFADTKWFYSNLLKLLLKSRVNENIEIDIDLLQASLSRLAISTKNKMAIHLILQEYYEKGFLNIWKDEYFAELSQVVSNLIDGKAIVTKLIGNSSDFNDFNSHINRDIEQLTEGLSNEMKLSITQCLLKNCSQDSPENAEIYSAWVTSERKVR